MKSFYIPLFCAYLSVSCGVASAQFASPPEQFIGVVGIPAGAPDEVVAWLSQDWPDTRYAPSGGAPDVHADDPMFWYGSFTFPPHVEYPRFEMTAHCQRIGQETFALGADWPWVVDGRFAAPQDGSSIVETILFSGGLVNLRVDWPDGAIAVMGCASGGMVDSQADLDTILDGLSAQFAQTAFYAPADAPSWLSVRPDADGVFVGQNPHPENGQWTTDFYMTVFPRPTGKGWSTSMGWFTYRFDDDPMS